MSLDIVPRVGVGPIRFGMTRAQVRRVAKKELECKVEKVRQEDILADGGIAVSYSPRELVSFIELRNQMVDLVDGEVIGLLDGDFEGKGVFATRCKKLVAHVQRFDQPDPTLSEGPGNYVFPNLILTLTATPFEPDDIREGYFMFVGLGDPTYLKSLRRMRRADPFRFRETPGVPMAKCDKAAAKAIAPFGPSYVLNEQGRIRRLLAGGGAREMLNEHTHAIADLDALEVLSLTGKQISDEGLAWLGKLTKLEALNLAGTSIGEKTLVRLNKLKYLTALVLPKGIGVAAIKYVGNLKALRSLSLRVDRQIEVAALSELTRIRTLRNLRISGDVTDAGLEVVARIQGLEELYIGSPNVSDVGLGALARISTLESLDVSSSQGISDAGFLALLALPNLSVVKIGYAPITEKAVAQLHEVLPDCEVRRG